MGKLREADLYPPLKTWLESNGYSVQAEVNSCDVVAQKGDDLIIIEMKQAINLELLLQVIRRQQAHASVYAAVPAPKTQDRRWRDLNRLVKRLEAGLLLIHIDSALPRVEVAFHPVEQQPRRRDKSTTRALLKEMAGRSVSMNVGGTMRRKLMTAYRESALAVAVSLEKTGATSPKEMRKVGAPANTGTILRGNHYNWFERLGLALYNLTPEGKTALEEPDYQELLTVLRQRRDACQPPEKTKTATPKKKKRTKPDSPVTPQSDPPPPPR